MAQVRTSELSKGGHYYRAHPGRELQRKRAQRARLGSAAYSFVETHPEFSERWHPRYDEEEHLYRLDRKEEADWRRFLREHGWEVGEKGRKARIAEHLRPGKSVRPLPRESEEARQRFHTEALGRSHESYHPTY